MEKDNVSTPELDQDIIGNLLFELTEEKLKSPTAVQSVFVIFLALVFLLGIPGNLIIIIVYCKTAQKTSCDLFIEVIACTDLIVCILSPLIYFTVEFDIHNTDDNVLLKLCSIAFIWLLTAIGASTILITILALDRYIRVCHPQRKPINQKWARGLSAFSFVFCFFITMFPDIQFWNVTTCTIVRQFGIPPKQLDRCFVLYVLCFLVVPFAYGSVVRKIESKIKVKRQMFQPMHTEHPRYENGFHYHQKHPHQYHAQHDGSKPKTSSVSFGTSNSKESKQDPNVCNTSPDIKSSKHNAPDNRVLRTSNVDPGSEMNPRDTIIIGLTIYRRSKSKTGECTPRSTNTSLRGSNENNRNPPINFEGNSSKRNVRHSSQNDNNVRASDHMQQVRERRRFNDNESRLSCGSLCSYCKCGGKMSQNFSLFRSKTRTTLDDDTSEQHNKIAKENQCLTMGKLEKTTSLKYKKRVADEASSHAVDKDTIGHVSQNDAKDPKDLDTRAQRIICKKWKRERKVSDLCFAIVC